MYHHHLTYLLRFLGRTIKYSDTVKRSTETFGEGKHYKRTRTNVAKTCIHFKCSVRVVFYSRSNFLKVFAGSVVSRQKVARYFWSVRSFPPPSRTKTGLLCAIIPRPWPMAGAFWCRFLPSSLPELTSCHKNSSLTFGNLSDHDLRRIKREPIWWEVDREPSRFSLKKILFFGFLFRIGNLICPYWMIFFFYFCHQIKFKCLRCLTTHLN